MEKKTIGFFKNSYQKKYMAVQQEILVDVVLGEKHFRKPDNFGSQFF